jgi:hypothetical protein
MSVFRPRNRLVNFRLSEDEFERLRSSCAQHGARSISDFARSSVLHRLEGVPASSAATQLVTQFGELERRVVQLIQLLDSQVAQPKEALAATAGDGDRFSRV